MSEELTTEQKKKAVNLQDLVYVKKYIEDNYYNKQEIRQNNDQLIGSLNNVTNGMYDQIYDRYTKEETDTKLATLESEMTTQINEAVENSTKSYTKEESDGLYYKKTDTVQNARNASYASEANSISLGSEPEFSFTNFDNVPNIAPGLLLAVLWLSDRLCINFPPIVLPHDVNYCSSGSYCIRRGSSEEKYELTITRDAEYGRVYITMYKNGSTYIPANDNADAKLDIYHI